MTALTAAEQFGCVADRWVNEVVVEDEYADFRSKR